MTHRIMIPAIIVLTLLVALVATDATNGPHSGE
jgi:hypothetical protein